MWAGQDDTQRFKTRVLKPPGGGSSDIFGSGPEESCPRRVKTHNQSQLGSALFGQDSAASTNGPDSARSTKPGNDSYNRLFGPPVAPPSTPKNHMRSNIALSGESSPAKSTCSTASSSSSTSTSVSAAGLANGYAASNGNGTYNDVTDGNPVTGTGYADQPSRGSAVQNGTTSPGEKSNDSSPPSSGKTPARNRVPPGGYSSGLW